MNPFTLTAALVSVRYFIAILAARQSAKPDLLEIELLVSEDARRESNRRRSR